MKALLPILGFVVAVLVIGCGGENPYVPDVDTTSGGRGFTLTISGPQTIRQDESTSFVVTVTSEVGFEGRAHHEVYLSYEGFPDFCDNSLDDDELVPDDDGESTNLNVTTYSGYPSGDATPPGTYTITVTGDNGDETEEATTTLTIEPGGPG